MKIYITENEFILIKHVLSLNKEEFNRIQHEELPTFDDFHKIIKLNNDNGGYYIENSNELLYSLQDFFMNFNIYQGFDKDYNLNEYGKISDGIFYKIDKMINGKYI